MFDLPLLIGGTPGTTPALPSGGYGIGVEQLTAMTRDHDSSALQQYGGASIRYNIVFLFLSYSVEISYSVFSCR